MIEIIPVKDQNEQLEFPFIVTAIATHFPVPHEMWQRYSEIDRYIGEMATKLYEAQNNYNLAILERAYFNSEVRLRD